MASSVGEISREEAVEHFFSVPTQASPFNTMFFFLRAKFTCTTHLAPIARCRSNHDMAGRILLLIWLAKNAQSFSYTPLIRKFSKDSVILKNRWGRDPDVQFEETKHPIFEPPAKPSIYELARLSIKDGCRDNAKLQEIAGPNTFLPKAY